MVMKKQILVLILSIIATENILCQANTKIVGEWRIFEMTSDRFYKNFETDSIYLFSKEDQENFKNPAIRKNITHITSMLSNNSIIIESDSVLVFNFTGMPAIKEKFTYDSEQSILYIGIPPNSNSLKLAKNEILELDLSDEYETNKFTFKRKKD
jgi:hypothetical protein